MYCRVCEVDKPIEELRPAEPRYVSRRCITCFRKYNREYAARPKIRVLARARALLRRYGLGSGEFEKLLAKQNGVCAICKLPAGKESNGLLHVDHCHRTGQVRGLLCIKCNTGIGKLGDDAARLITAAQYLTFASETNK